MSLKGRFSSTFADWIITGAVRTAGNPPIAPMPPLEMVDNYNKV